MIGKTNKALLKELRKELHYYQIMVRVDINSLKASIRKCKEVAAEMRRLQKEIRKEKNMENDEIKQKIIDAMEIAGYKPISFSYRVNHFRAYMPVVSVDFKKGSKTVRVNVYNGDLNSVMVYIDDYYISLPILNVAGWLENR